MHDMKYLPSFEWTSDTYEGRYGEPGTRDAVLGEIRSHYSDLLRMIDHSVHYLTGYSRRRSTITRKVSPFNDKVRLLASNISDIKEAIRFNTGRIPTDEFFWELQQMCVQAHALYRLTLGEGWDDGCEHASSEVVGIPAFHEELDRRSGEVLDADRLLDIADYICFAGIQFEQFFDVDSHTVQTG